MLYARFKLDEEGRPRSITTKKFHHVHYEITLHFVAPSEVDSVTYRLDPTYYDPLREVSRGSENNDFEEAITSYGDFVIEVGTSGSSKGHPIRVRQKLTDALRRGHRDDISNQAVRDAIKALEGN
jgi:hypothetical protein